jgi:hypothetical protein
MLANPSRREPARCSPGLQSGVVGFQTREKALFSKYRALALV